MHKLRKFIIVLLVILSVLTVSSFFLIDKIEFYRRIISIRKINFFCFCGSISLIILLGAIKLCQRYKKPIIISIVSLIILFISIDTALFINTGLCHGEKYYEFNFSEGSRTYTIVIKEYHRMFGGTQGVIFIKKNNFLFSISDVYSAAPDYEPIGFGDYEISMQDNKIIFKFKTEADSDYSTWICDV